LIFDALSIKGGFIMYKKIAILPMLLLIIIPAFAFAGAVQLPQTGQTTCYDTSGAVIDCAGPGKGQDGNVRAGVPWPNPRFTDNGNGTVTDNLTGLIWLKNANCFGQLYWASAIPSSNSLASGACGLTDGSHAGDWRLPNVNELESLVNSEPTICAAWLNGLGFTNVQTSWYWSSSTGASSTGEAWVVDMLGGSMEYGSKSYNVGCVWPVRAGQ
jgi:hypothetical protein